MKQLIASILLSVVAIAATSRATAQETLASGNLKVAKDFKLELLYTVPKGTEGSWVAMCTDPKGRLIVSDQYGKLYRFMPPALGSTPPIKPEVIDLSIGQAHGLLYAFDSLYVMVNESPKGNGMYRVRDTNGDDKFDDVQLLRRIQGGGEHGLHSMIVSPDGKSIYVVCGNSTKLTEIDSSLIPLNWGEDDLLPRLPTGFMDADLAPGGWIARTDPDGKKWELVAGGFRNQFDAQFNHDGELFTYDADMEWDIGDPWYRPTRINHVISGAEFGFRNGNGKWPEYYIDSFGSVADVGPGSPTGIAFGYGAKFPAKYQEALFILDWSFGKLRAVHLSPKGSSYVGEVEEFISGQPFAVTDLVINPKDGAMYVAVGGRRTQSALYRVTYTGRESTAPHQPKTRFAAEREMRRKLESFHGHKDEKAVKTAWPFLDHADRAIRYAARIALEWQDPSEWQEKALSEKNPRKSIAALVALARVSGRDAAHRKPSDPVADPILREKIIASLDRISWTKLSNQDRIDLSRAYSLAFIRLGQPEAATRERLIARFEPLFPARNREVDAILAQILVYLQSPQAAAKLVAALKTAPSQEEQIDYAVPLRVLKTGWTQPLREDYFKWFVKSETYHGGNTFAPSLKAARNQALALLSESEKAPLKSILESKPAQPSARAALAARPVVKEWTVNDLTPIVEKGLKGKRNLERGRQLFGDMACYACHHFRNEGGSVGPDLTGVAGRFSVRDLLESLIEPSLVISDQYEAIVVRKKDGDIVSGRIANLNQDQVNIVEDMLNPGHFTNVRRQDIQSMEPSKVSMMPDGLLNTFKEDEIADMVAFLMRRAE